MYKIINTAGLTCAQVRVKISKVFQVFFYVFIKIEPLIYQYLFQKYLFLHRGFVIHYLIYESKTSSKSTERRLINVQFITNGVYN